MHGNRIRLRQQLEKERLELERIREEKNSRMQREMVVSQQSQSMDVPAIMSTPNQVTIEVPNKILEVRTKLAHPTTFHVSEVQKRQVTNFLSSSSSPIQHSRSAPPQNMRGVLGVLQPGVLTNAMTNDPLLSGASAAGSGGSPMKTSSSFTPQMGLTMNPDMRSPNNFAPQIPGVFGGMFANPSNNIGLKNPDSPTMMMVDQSPDDIQEQIIEDIMGLEEKFGDTLGLPYVESAMMAPQTLPVSSNLFDFGGGATPTMVSMGSATPTMVLPQMSASCPADVKNEMGVMTPGSEVRVHEKERQKKNNHNMIERRRRFNINDRIKELGSLLPVSEAQNKGTILKASVDYIRKLQRDSDRMKLVEAKQHQLEDTNRQMILRIRELELTARVHQIPTPSLNPETMKLAEAAEQALGSVTPRSKSPGSTNLTPVHMFGTGEDIAEMLRSSPSVDLSKLQIKQERMDSLSPCGIDQISPLQQQQTPGGRGPSPYHQNPQPTGDIFSFNLPINTSLMSSQPPSLQGGNVISGPHSGLQLFGNT